METNPPRNNQPETHRDDGPGAFLPSRPWTGPRDRPTGGGTPAPVKSIDYPSDRKISGCLKKLMVAPSVPPGDAACSNSSGGR